MLLSSLMLLYYQLKHQKTNCYEVLIDLFKNMSSKSIYLNISYEWKLSYSIMEKCNLFSIRDNLIEFERFGHFKGPQKFYLILATSINNSNNLNIFNLQLFIIDEWQQIK